MVDLPLTPDESILDYWHLELVDLAMARGLDELAVRVMIDRGGLKPTLRVSEPPVSMRLEEDPGDYRGTGGLLSDVARDYDDDDELLVINGSVVPADRLVALVDRLDATEADVAILTTASGEPLGVTRVRCGALRGIKAVGFVDLKEQALPQIAAEFDVRVARVDLGGQVAVRTLASYVEAVRGFTRRVRRGARLDPDAAFDEDWRATFGLVESGAQVADTAVIHDAVILRGATVGAGATVVRSVVAGGATVPAGALVVDRVVGASGRRRADVELGGRRPSVSAGVARARGKNGAAGSGEGGR